MNILNKFPQLRVLIIPYIADDELLAKLGQSYQFITNWNFFGSASIGRPSLIFSVMPSTDFREWILPAAGAA